MIEKDRRFCGISRLPLLIAALLAIGWGSTGHRIINTRATYHLPAGMDLFVQDSTIFGQHGSDADYRKNTDTAEGPKHYIDLESYSSYSELTLNLDSVIAVYGWAAIKENGILPWATVRAYDSLVAQLRRGDWTRAPLTAADLGHYVGDGHQPLHVTVNYNGQLTGNDGIHSRYESGMINIHEGALTITPASAPYVVDRFGYVLSYCIAAHGCVDSILRGDTDARSASLWSGSGTPPASYYDALWTRTSTLTREQFQRATVALASLWYSAWVDAGLIIPAAVRPPRQTLPATLSLGNYPNPFNPSTTITYSLPVGGSVHLSLFTSDGRELATLVSELQAAGNHAVRLDGRSLATGVYLCRLRLGTFAESHKLVLLR
jgi:hypothetical protein